LNFIGYHKVTLNTFQSQHQRTEGGGDATSWSISGGSSLNSWPHGRELSIGNNRRHFEFDARALDPRGEMGSHLADVARNSNGHSCSTDGLADAIFELKPSKQSPGPPALMYSANGVQASQDPPTVGKFQMIK
jgi:hypothetical protein